MHPQHRCPVSQCYSSTSERLCSAHASLNAECDLCLGRSFSSFARRKGIKPGFSLLSSFGVARSTSSVACRLQLRPGVWSMCRTCLSACTIYLEVAIMESRQRLYDRASELIIEGNGRHDTKLYEGLRQMSSSPELAWGISGPDACQEPREWLESAGPVFAVLQCIHVNPIN